MKSMVLTNIKPWFMIVRKEKDSLVLNKEKWFSVALFLPGIFILIFGIIGIFTNSEAISRFLIIVGVVLFVLSVLIIGLKYSNFFDILRIHNPIAGLSANSIATVLAVWAILAAVLCAIPSLTGLVSVGDKLGVMSTDIKEILQKLTDFIAASKGAGP
jgi:hypothetical protein